MNEINRFLAERAMGWVKGYQTLGENKIPEWQTKDGESTGYYTDANQIGQFAPMELIQHSFKVQAEIAKMGMEVIKQFLSCLDDVVEGKWVLTSSAIIKPGQYFRVVNATAAQRSEAAVRTLGTDEEIKRLL